MCDTYTIVSIQFIVTDMSTYYTHKYIYLNNIYLQIFALFKLLINYILVVMNNNRYLFILRNTGLQHVVFSHIVDMNWPQDLRDKYIDMEGGMVDELTCSCCADLLVEPTTLECGHTVCRLCLAHWYMNGRRECPECRQKWHTDLVGKVNYTLRYSILFVYPHCSNLDNNRFKIILLALYIALLEGEMCLRWTKFQNTWPPFS